MRYRQGCRSRRSVSDYFKFASREKVRWIARRAGVICSPLESVTFSRFCAAADHESSCGFFLFCACLLLYLLMHSRSSPLRCSLSGYQSVSSTAEATTSNLVLADWSKNWSLCQNAFTTSQIGRVVSLRKNTRWNSSSISPLKILQPVGDYFNPRAHQDFYKDNRNLLEQFRSSTRRAVKSLDFSLINDNKVFSASSSQFCRR
jgi:hypothetical protein